MIETNHPENEEVKAQWSFVLCSCIKLDLLKPFFNTSTEEVKEWFVTSFMPFNWKLGLLVKNHPDMYGPFWILTSCIFSILVAANSVTRNQKSDEKETL